VEYVGVLRCEGACAGDLVGVQQGSDGVLIAHAEALNSSAIPSSLDIQLVYPFPAFPSHSLEAADAGLPVGAYALFSLIFAP
jgi:hypothetical protein